MGDLIQREQAVYSIVIIRCYVAYTYDYVTLNTGTKIRFQAYMFVMARSTLALLFVVYRGIY